MKALVGNGPMKSTVNARVFRAAAVAALLLMFAVRALAGAEAAEGAGATFPFPLYARWTAAYAAQTGVTIGYSAIGSRKGIERIKSGQVDFAASDIPLKAGELGGAGLMQFPMAIGGVVPVINVDGVKGDMRLTSRTLAGIFLGRIRRWNDKELAELNPALKLPNAPIVVFHRSDASGTTWIFTDYLAKVSPGWNKSIGRDSVVQWPVGQGMEGNAGVAAAVKDTRNSIGYTEYAYAAENWLKRPLLRNRSGEFVKPFINSFVSASRNADWEKVSTGEASLTDQPGKESWPITGATFILVRKNPIDCTRTMAALAFFGWAYRSGANMAEQNSYLPLPKYVYEGIEKRWAEEINCPVKEKSRH